MIPPIMSPVSMFPNTPLLYLNPELRSEGLTLSEQQTCLPFLAVILYALPWEREQERSQKYPGIRTSTRNPFIPNLFLLPTSPTLAPSRSRSKLSMPLFSQQDPRARSLSKSFLKDSIILGSQPHERLLSCILTSYSTILNASHVEFCRLRVLGHG